MPPHLFQLTMLFIDFIGANQLESVPAEIGNMLNLQDLDLSKLNESVFPLSENVCSILLTTAFIAVYRFQCVYISAKRDW